MSLYILGIDTGGTFTDFILLRPDKKLRRWKVLSTPEDPSIAIINGLKELLGNAEDLELEIIHGTTVGTNAFLERKGAKTCLITTKGFEDVLFIGRQARPTLYDLFVKKPSNIIDPQDVIGITERIDAKGKIIIALTEEELKRVVNFVKNGQYDSVAICLLHSYINPENEKQVASYLKGKGIEAIISSKLLPEFREFERTSTTVINAYLGPVVGNYIKRLEQKLNTKRLFIQQSSGGCQPAKGIDKVAVSTILSGPAGGVLASLELGRCLGEENIITFDMGGTSTDVSLCPGKLLYTRNYKLQGFPINLPVIDVHTVGAGGGSIAWIDKGGLLKVGPQSAGAKPGPICYGQGQELTVTDANLFLGRLRADKFLAGRMRLFEDNVLMALERLGSHLKLSPIETALGIIKLVNTNMVQAVREVSIEKGYDPRNFTMVSFGGAAGLHCLEVAEELEIKKVIIPKTAGVFSAMGLAASQLLFERSKSLFWEVASNQDIMGKLISIKKSLEEELLNNMPKELIDDISMSSTNTIIEVRYKGQSFELMIPLTDKWQDSFHKEHKRLYGYLLPDQPLEITSIRTRKIIKRDGKEVLFPRLDIDFSKDSFSVMDEDHYDKKQVIFKEGAKLIKIIPKKDIKNHSTMKGPLLIIDDFTTIFILEGWRVFNVQGHLIVCKED